MEALSWLGDIFQWLGRWIPRIQIVRKTEKGVRFRRGKHAIQMDPGIHIYWPIFTEIEVVFVIRQVIDMPLQTLTSKDGQAVIVGGIVVYRIDDVMKYLVDNYDADSSIREVGGAALRQFVIGQTVEEIQEGRRALDTALTRCVREELESFGCGVEKARITHYARARVLNLAMTSAGLSVPANARAIPTGL